MIKFLFRIGKSFVEKVADWRRRKSSSNHQIHPTASQPSHINLPTQNAPQQTSPQPFNSILAGLAAANRYFTPIEEETEILKFVRPDLDSPVTPTRVLHDLGDDSHSVTTTRTRVITNAGIFDFNQIIGKCDVCESLEAVLYYCADCAINICEKHARCLVGKDLPPIICCLKHTKKRKGGWNTRTKGPLEIWAARHIRVLTAQIHQQLKHEPKKPVGATLTRRDGTPNSKLPESDATGGADSGNRTNKSTI